MCRCDPEHLIFQGVLKPCPNVITPSWPAFESLESRQLLSGTVTAKLVPVSIKSAAKAADSALNNYSTYDLQVTVTGDNDWASGDLKAVLFPAGIFMFPPRATVTRHSKVNGPPRQISSLTLSSPPRTSAIPSSSVPTALAAIRR